MANIQHVSSLAPLSRMESLKSLKLRYINLNYTLSSTKWLPKCLPRYLTELRLQFSAPQGYGWSDDYFRLCNLNEAVPHLKRLKIRCEHKLPVKLRVIFATLPRGLTFFKISVVIADMPPDAISRLPRSLKSFEIMCEEEMEDSTISNKHFVGLPESLQSFIFGFGHNASYNEKLLDLLPESIVRLFSYVNHCGTRMRFMPDATLDWASSHPLLQAPNI